MERHFDEELNQLKERLLRMGAIAEEMIQKAVKALRERSEKLTQEVFESEKMVNQMHVEIDDRCLKLIALHQPMAADLRLITAAMKINSDLERIADQAVNAGQTCYYHLFKESPVPQISMITQMAEISQKMLRDSLDAFSRRDVALAEKVLKQDEEEDRLKAQALTSLIDLLKKDPSHSSQYVDLILLSRNMERIGDHATNVAEDVIFMVQGKDIRHHLDHRDE
ncbi:MAG TPA: phosphate signaling complex protein PhoU [Elusimicrobiota bacterium]|nr:phosphate signaling complex protein PhoU [Elusimicrobiota bacterium]HMX94512.1 phosphate signaling complex protein PhoU [Elusimicrobiota bacterium]HMZ27594.1 phosphate signaling complex protein PhoU [Elusimicrobiota bacterium]HNA60369.1 phosphate signaling complex protein PhoU [Elusimicrobiota bacterium]HNC73834.1 phosphate signaling complex protein PhoU [Elusimicrobiota bacterium]